MFKKLATHEQTLNYSCIILLHFTASNNGIVITVICNIKGHTLSVCFIARTMIFYFMTSYYCVKGVSILGAKTRCKIPILYYSICRTKYRNFDNYDTLERLRKITTKARWLPVDEPRPKNSLSTSNKLQQK